MEAATSFLTRNICSAYTAAVSTAVFLTAFVANSPQIFSDFNSGGASVPKEEYAFKNGVILPHNEYLYEYSKARGHFIVGTKAPGHDYTRWESGYTKFGKIEAVTVVNSAAKTTWTWSLETTKKFMGLTALQVLFWCLITIFFALLVGYLAQKFLKKQSSKTRDFLWRSIMLRKYGELKDELLSVQKLAVLYYESSCKLEDALAAEQKRNGTAAERANQSLKDQIQALALENERLRAELGARRIEKSPALLDRTEEVRGAENVEVVPVQDTAPSTAPAVDVAAPASPSVATADAAAAPSPSAAAAASTAVSPPVSAASLSSTEGSPTHEGQESAPAAGIAAPAFASIGPVASDAAPADAPAAVAPAPDAAAADATVAPSLSAAAVASPATSPATDAASPSSTADGVTLGANGKPKKQRLNRRADGTIRTASHPDYTPPRVNPGGNVAGNGAGVETGNGLAASIWGGGRGGNNGAPSGWRGGRGRGGGRGGRGGGGWVGDGGPPAQYGRRRG